jgi:ABC-type antimicrobial peptide transport system permease subunit
VALVAIGGAVGLVVSILLTRSLAGVLYGVGPFDVTAFASAAAVLMLTGVLASLLPALRTARVEPMVALREQ